ncbi:MAG: ImmA/IrrE family metallo-endopeptidase [Oscillospiraceae bacterium]|nr:ImmA/IrrE family metallo-endopeptidase [Oscillospiraceae bacterium]
MPSDTYLIVKKADSLVKKFATRDPARIADELGIIVKPCPFRQQRGAYNVILRNRFIFIKDDLPAVMNRIVMAHEIGHDVFHRDEALMKGGFREFNIFDMRDNRMEFEANLFAAQMTLDDDEFLEYCERGYDIQQIAIAMKSDINLVALKSDTLISQGYRLRPQEHRNDFLKFSR